MGRGGRSVSALTEEEDPVGEEGDSERAGVDGASALARERTVQQLHLPSRRQLHEAAVVGGASTEDGPVGRQSARLSRRWRNGAPASADAVVRARSAMPFLSTLALGRSVAFFASVLPSEK